MKDKSQKQTTKQESKQSIKIVIGDLPKKAKRRKARRIASAGQRKMTGQLLGNRVGELMNTRIIRYGDDFGTASATIKAPYDSISRGFSQQTRVLATDNYNRALPPNLGTEPRGSAEEIDKALERPPHLRLVPTPQLKQSSVRKPADPLTDMRRRENKLIAQYSDVDKLKLSNKTLPMNPNVDLDPWVSPAPEPTLPTARQLAYDREVGNLKAKVIEQKMSSLKKAPPAPPLEDETASMATTEV